MTTASGGSRMGTSARDPRAGTPCRIEPCVKSGRPRGEPRAGYPKLLNDDPAEALTLRSWSSDETGQLGP